MGSIFFFSTKSTKMNNVDIIKIVVICCLLWQGTITSDPNQEMTHAKNSADVGGVGVVAANEDKKKKVN